MKKILKISIVLTVIYCSFTVFSDVNKYKLIGFPQKNLARIELSKFNSASNLYPSSKIVTLKVGNATYDVPKDYLLDLSHLIPKGSISSDGFWIKTYLPDMLAENKINRENKTNKIGFFVQKNYRFSDYTEEKYLINILEKSYEETQEFKYDLQIYKNIRFSDRYLAFVDKDKNKIKRIFQCSINVPYPYCYRRFIDNELDLEIKYSFNMIHLKVWQEIDYKSMKFLETVTRKID